MLLLAMQSQLGPVAAPLGQAMQAIPESTGKQAELVEPKLLATASIESTELAA